MPVQQHQSNLVARFGGRIAAANAEHADKPLDLGFRRLPPGIKNGVGRLHTVALKQYSQDEKIVALRGQEYLHVIGVVVSPKEHEGEKIEGHQMFLRFPLCDIPANPQNSFSKPKSLEDNWYDFQQFFMRFGIDPPKETPQTDPGGAKTWAYYMGAVGTLTARIKQGGDSVPHYQFSTRAWRPQGAKEDRVEEEWGKQCVWDGKVDPGAGMQDGGYNGPPTITADGLPPGPPPAPPSQPKPVTQSQSAAALPDDDQDPADVVAVLVEAAMADPEGKTSDGKGAIKQLVEMAKTTGWTDEQIASADSWEDVGEMVFTPPESVQEQATPATPTVGSRWLFARRSKDGSKLKNNKGEDFPSTEVEVTLVNGDTCTVKSVKDGKEVLDIRSKKPLSVKFEWLEPIQS